LSIYHHFAQSLAKRVHVLLLALYDLFVFLYNACVLLLLLHSSLLGGDQLLIERINVGLHLAPLLAEAVLIDLRLLLQTLLVLLFQEELLLVLLQLFNLTLAGLFHHLACLTGAAALLWQRYAEILENALKIKLSQIRFAD